MRSIFVQISFIWLKFRNLKTVRFLTIATLGLKSLEQLNRIDCVISQFFQRFVLLLQWVVLFQHILIFRRKIVLRVREIHGCSLQIIASICVLEKKNVEFSVLQKCEKFVCERLTSNLQTSLFIDLSSWSVFSNKSVSSASLRFCSSCSNLSSIICCVKKWEI